MTLPPPRLGKVQLQIMQVLWERRTATARQITDALNEKQSIAHSTVQTLLRQMEAKGAITHDAEERTFTYRPLVRQNEITETALRDVLTRLFHGSVYGLVSHLLQNESVSQDELSRLRHLIEEETQR